LGIAKFEVGGIFSVDLRVSWAAFGPILK
jgi:hypothetical protein